MMMSRIRGFFKLNSQALGAGLISGVLVGTSYIPFPPWALIFCYVPLWFFALKNAQTWKQVFWAGWITQFVLTLIGFHWISFVAHEYGFMPWPFAILTLLLFATLMHLYVPLSVLLGWWIYKKMNLRLGAAALLCAAFLALGEIYWPSIFNWNMGYTLLWIHSPLAQWADVVGFAGLSFAAYLINAWLLTVILKRDKKTSMISAVIFVGLGGFLYIGGMQKAENWKATDSELKTLVVQANIGNVEKFYAEKGMGYQQYIADQFFNLTRQGLVDHPETQLVIWPESAFPDYLDAHAASRNYPSQFRRFTQSIQRPLLTGAYSQDPPTGTRDGRNHRKDYNGLFLFNEKAELVGVPYHKTQLLIFGEWLPLVDQFPILAKYNPGGFGFGRGQGPTVMRLNSVQNNIQVDAQIGGQICYESLDPQFSAGLASKGAEILVNVTNDSWFGPRFEPSQHLYMTLARGLETRRPMIRSTNTGISSVLLADGSVLESSPVYEKWAGLFDVKYLKNPPQTFFTLYGSAGLPALILVFLLLVIGLGKIPLKKGAQSE